MSAYHSLSTIPYMRSNASFVRSPRATCRWLRGGFTSTVGHAELQVHYIPSLTYFLGLRTHSYTDRNLAEKPIHRFCARGRHPSVTCPHPSQILLGSEATITPAATYPPDSQTCTASDANKAEGRSELKLLAGAISWVRISPSRQWTRSSEAARTLQSTFSVPHCVHVTRPRHPKLPTIFLEVCDAVNICLWFGWSVGGKD